MEIALAEAQGLDYFDSEAWTSGLIANADNIDEWLLNNPLLPRTPPMAFVFDSSTQLQNELRRQEQELEAREPKIAELLQELQAQ